MENNFEGENQESGYQGFASFIWEIVKIFLLAFIIIVPIRVFLFQPFFVQGDSMKPTFENSEYLIINELGYKRTVVGLGEKKLFTVNYSKELKRFDVVVFRYPKDPDKYFIKRVIGLPGEKIEVKNWKVKIYNAENPNGFTLDESAYLSDKVFTSSPQETPWQLGPDEYFVMGDNRSGSSDSRLWGPVPKFDIIGKAIFRAWPLNRINIL